MTRSRLDNRADGNTVDELLTVAQAGDYLRTGERFVRRLVAERRISYVKLGKYVRLQRSTLDAFIEAGRVPCDLPLSAAVLTATPVKSGSRKPRTMARASSSSTATRSTVLCASER